jgi:hypothetical protein
MLSELEVRKQYQIKNSSTFTLLENLNDSEDINVSLYELKQHIPCFDEDVQDI